MCIIYWGAFTRHNNYAKIRLNPEGGGGGPWGKEILINPCKTMLIMQNNVFFYSAETIIC